MSDLVTVVDGTNGTGGMATASLEKTKALILLTRDECIVLRLHYKNYQSHLYEPSIHPKHPRTRHTWASDLQVEVEVASDKQRSYVILATIHEH